LVVTYGCHLHLQPQTGADKGKKKKVAKVESYKLYIYKASSGMSKVCATRGAGLCAVTGLHQSLQPVAVAYAVGLS
jgi:hypothetical protein